MIRGLYYVDLPDPQLYTPKAMFGDEMIVNVEGDVSKEFSVLDGYSK